MTDDNKDEEKVANTSKVDISTESIEFDSKKNVQIFSDDIPYGVYNIKSVNSGKYLSIEDGGRELRTNVQLWDNPENWDSQWIIDKNGHTKESYNIRNSNSGLFINKKGSSKENCVKIFTWDSAKTGPSSWIFELIDKKNGIYTIKNMHAQKYLNCEKDGKENGTKMWTWDKPDKSSQWTLHCLLPMIKGVSNVIGEAKYTIMLTKKIGKCINVISGKSQNGQNIQLWDNPDSLDSQFIIKKLKNNDNIFNIQFCKSEYHFISIENGDPDNDGNAHLFNNPENNETKWYFDLIDLNTLRVAIRNYNSNLYLNCKSGKTQKGVNIWQWSSVQHLGTQWYLKPIDLEFVDIKYDINNAIKGKLTTKYLITNILNNKKKVDETQTWKTSAEVKNESWFEYNGGFKIPIAVSVELNNDKKKNNFNTNN